MVNNYASEKRIEFGKLCDILYVILEFVQETWFWGMNGGSFLFARQRKRGGTTARRAEIVCFRKRGGCRARKVSFAKEDD